MTLDELTEKLDNYAKRTMSAHDRFVRQKRPYKHMLVPWFFISVLVWITIAIDRSLMLAQDVITIARLLVLMAVSFSFTAVSYVVAYPFYMLGELFNWTERTNK